MSGALRRRAIAELLATMFLLAAIVGSGIMGERLSPDNAAVALLAFVVDAYGPTGRAELSAGGMASMVNGPFGRWTKVRIRKAYDLLVKTGLFHRMHRDRSGVRAPRALFQTYRTRGPEGLVSPNP